MIRPQDLSGFRTDFFENLHGLAHIAQWGIFAAVESPRVDSTGSQDDFVIGPMHPRSRVDDDVTPETLRRVEAEVRDRGPFGYDLRKAFWPYWLHALTRHRWRRRGAGWFASL